MKAKLLIFLLIELSLLSSLLCSGCVTEEKYVSETTPTDYILLKSDGTYLVVQEAVDTFGGNWIKESNTIVLLLPYGSYELISTDEGLVDEGGELWIKE